MKAVMRTTILVLSLGAAACSDGGSSGDDGENIKTIDREEVPDGRFKPQGLEDTIDALATGIEESGANEDLSFGVVLKELTNFWRPVVVGANRALSELEVVGDVKGTTQESLTVEEEVAEQMSFVEEQIDLGVDGLVIAPHNEDLLPLMEEFAELGAPMVTIDSDMPDSGREIYIGTDNGQAGITGGETMLDVLDGATGRVLILGNTDPSWTGGFDRTNAAADIIESAGNEVEILNSLWAAGEVEQIAEAIADESSGLPLVGMIGMFSNAHALGTAAVDADLDEMPKIVAFDFEPDTLSHMEDGVISATHVQRQYYMGYMSVYVLYSIQAVGLKKTKETLGPYLINGFHLDTGLDVIRARDLDEYNSFVDDLGI